MQKKKNYKHLHLDEHGTNLFLIFRGFYFSNTKSLINDISHMKLLLPSLIHHKKHRLRVFLKLIEGGSVVIWRNRLALKSQNRESDIPIWTKTFV